MTTRANTRLYEVRTESVRRRDPSRSLLTWFIDASGLPPQPTLMGSPPNEPSESLSTCVNHVVTSSLEMIPLLGTRFQIIFTNVPLVSLSPSSLSPQPRPPEAPAG